MSGIKYYGVQLSWEYNIIASEKSRHEILPREHLEGLISKVFNGANRPDINNEAINNVVILLHALIYAEFKVYDVSREISQTADFGTTKMIKFMFPEHVIFRCVDFPLPIDERFSGTATTLILDPARNHIPLVKYSSSFLSFRVKEVTIERANAFLELNTLCLIEEWITKAYLEKNNLLHLTQKEEKRAASVKAASSGSK
ncbi:TPA_asm: M [Peat soil associated betacytorhabdovirus 2]|jgi:hypothetical protein|nr:TPA_asm: M [Peat soil associated betacytorhabdovirus 2]